MRPRTSYCSASYLLIQIMFVCKFLVKNNKMDFQSSKFYIYFYNFLYLNSIIDCKAKYSIFSFRIAIADIIDRNRPILVALIDQTQNLCILIFCIRRNFYSSNNWSKNHLFSKKVSVFGG